MRIVVALLVLVLAGCANWGEQLYLAHDTKIGLDASINTATTSGSVDLGYDRRFITFVPRSVEIEEQDTELVGSGRQTGEGDGNTEDSQDVENTKAREIMSVMACSNLSVSLFTIDYYDESLATGRAAVLFAKALAQDRKWISEDYFECFRKKDRQQKELENQTKRDDADGGDGQ
jgi:hypothetical protein